LIARLIVLIFVIYWSVATIASSEYIEDKAERISFDGGGSSKDDCE
jgi:hypothetical protein